MQTSPFLPIALATTVAAAVSVTNPALATAGTHQSMTAPKGTLQLSGPAAVPNRIVNIELSKNRAFEPITLTPHLYYGASDDFTFGISHQRGLCITGENGGCGDDVYNDIGLDTLYRLTDSADSEVDLHIGLPISHFGDPFIMGVRAGVLGRVNFGDMALVLDPALYVGITERDRGNKEALDVPLWLYFQVSKTVAPYVGTGINGGLDGFGDRFRIPVSGGVMVEAATGMHIGAEFAFTNMLGKNGGLSGRRLSAGGSFRF